MTPFNLPDRSTATELIPPSLSLLSNQSEEIFLDMFEDEHRESTKRPTRLDYVMSDAALLLPPAATPLTGIDFAKRLPCGEVRSPRYLMFNSIHLLFAFCVLCSEFLEMI